MSVLRTGDLQLTVAAGQPGDDGGVGALDCGANPGAGALWSVPATVVQTLSSRVTVEHQVCPRDHTDLGWRDHAGTGEVAEVCRVLLPALSLSTAGGGGATVSTAGAPAHLLGHGGDQQEQEGDGWDSHSVVSDYTDNTGSSVYISSLLYFLVVSHSYLCFVPCSGPIQRQPLLLFILFLFDVCPIYYSSPKVND